MFSQLVFVRFALLRCLFFVCLFASWQAASAADKRPDILLILADDLGFSDLGCYGGEINTPNLDTLASNGLRYSQFYNTGRCWPTRSSMLTGYYAQQVRRDKINGKWGYQARRPKWAPLVSSKLTDAGYRCYQSGKWHIDGAPLGNGFAHSYGIRDHNNYFKPEARTVDGQQIPQPTSKDYYETTSITDQALGMLKEHMTQHGDAPFFQFLAYTAPHFPLHAPADEIAKYAGKYDQGWDATRTSRWRKIGSLGIVRGNISPLETAIGSPYHSAKSVEALGPNEVIKEKRWVGLTPAQKKFQAAKMEVHAAMVDRMDQEIGRVIEFLRKQGRLDNTLVLFVSDNGASSELLVRGGGHDRQAKAGSAETFLCLGPGWSRAANTPFRRHKSWVHEGGISTPFIVHWPQGIKDPGSWRTQVGHVIDVPATMLAAAGVADVYKTSTADAPVSPGISLKDSITTKGNQTTDRTLWWLHEGNRAIRDGDWKLVAAEGDQWELYDMKKDRTESKNLAKRYPDRVSQLKAKWKAMKTQIATDAETN